MHQEIFIISFYGTGGDQQIPLRAIPCRHLNLEGPVHSPFDLFPLLQHKFPVLRNNKFSEISAFHLPGHRSVIYIRTAAHVVYNAIGTKGEYPVRRTIQYRLEVIVNLLYISSQPDQFIYLVGKAFRILFHILGQLFFLRHILERLNGGNNLSPLVINRSS